MKLGDNMAPIEACNAWNDVCPRKTRPPKIGDIPRHVAVDEESPGSSASRSVAQVQEAVATAAVKSMLERSTGCHTEHGKPASSGALPLLETFMKPPLDSSKKVEQVAGIPGEPESERAESHKRSLNSNSSIPHGKAFNGPCSIFKEISATPAPEKLDSLEHSRRNTCVQVLKSIGETEVKLYENEIPDEIIQVRKDSALYIDEKRIEAAELRDSLVAIGVGPRTTSGISHQANVEEALSSRLSGQRARRESSGYFSNLGTFDEDRWGGSCTIDLANQQDAPLSAKETLRERRRSSTKNRLPMGVGQQVNRMTTLVCPVSDETSVSLSENDVTGLGKTVRVEMPNIDEQSSLELNKSVEHERSFNKEMSDGEGELRNRILQISLENSTSMTQEVTLNTDKSSAIQRASELTKDLDETKELGRKLESIDLGQQWCTSPRATNRQRSRMVVHQYSSPNITSTELERIVERPHSENLVRSKTEFQHVVTSKSVVDVECPTAGEYEEDDNEQVVIANLDGSNRSGEVEGDARKLLPRSIKVYQLLSTQSEDRGDGDARLFDRRISLQIPRHEEEVARENVSGAPPPTISTPSGPEYPEEKKLVHADSVPILKIPSSDATGVDNELRLCAGGRTPGSDNSSGPVIPGIRPIYPYCPYSPYASPQGSPRTNRRRPLRESRRVSIDSRQGALQLNQYKLFNNIGQGSYGIVKLAYNEEDQTHYAMKILSKKKLMKKAGIFGRIAPGRKGVTNPLAKVYREIALLKKLDHPNVVKLVEVLDDPDEDNLYLVFELVQKGEVLQLPTDKPLDEETARIHFRDVVMGVEYLHYQRIVHRDIKPSNLLVDSEGRVKVADLGVSAELRAAGELLTGSAGTPAFAAPETTTPGAQYSGTLCDVWSMGVTLYSLVTGKVPWDGAGSIIGVQSAVRSEPLRFPESPCLTDELRDLVSRMLSKDPTSRITLAEIKENSWLTKKGEEPLPNEADNCRLPVTVTDEEVARVVTRVPKLDTLILIKTMLKQHSFQNPFLPRRIVRSGCMAGDAGMSAATLKQQVSSDTTDSSTELLATVETLKSKTEQFHKAGRSNSAPDSYEWQTNGRQISSDSLLPPVTESSSQEQAEVEKR